MSTSPCIPIGFSSRQGWREAGVGEKESKPGAVHRPAMQRTVNGLAHPGAELPRLGVWIAAVGAAGARPFRRGGLRGGVGRRLEGGARRRAGAMTGSCGPMRSWERR